jgi:hypothetical protein
VGWQQQRLQNSLKFSTVKIAAFIFSAADHVISLSVCERSLRFLSEDKQCHLKEESALSPLEPTWRFLDKSCSNRGKEMKVNIKAAA